MRRLRPSAFANLKTQPHCSSLWWLIEYLRNVISLLKCYILVIIAITLRGLKLRLWSVLVLFFFL